MFVRRMCVGCASDVRRMCVGFICQDVFRYGLVVKGIFLVTPWAAVINGLLNASNLALYGGPRSGPQHHNGDTTPSEVLLIPHVLVGRQQQFIACPFGSGKQRPVLEL